MIDKDNWVKRRAAVLFARIESLTMIDAVIIAGREYENTKSNHKEILNDD